jgi:hypothetical protein
MTIEPKLNINGSDADVLIDAHLEVVAALRKARELHAAITPHGRDFQTAAEGDFMLARETHAHDAEMLLRIECRVSEIALAIHRQK